MMRRLSCRSQVPEGDVPSSMVSYPSSLLSSLSPAVSRMGMGGRGALGMGVKAYSLYAHGVGKT